MSTRAAGFVARSLIAERVRIAWRVLLVLSLLCAVCVRASAAVRLGVVNWIGYGPLYCAAANGYFKKHGADVKLVTFSDNSLMAGALRGGELEASTLTYDQVILADARGWGLKVVMPLDYSVGGDAIVASAAVRTIQDLKGRKVAFQPLSPSDFLLGYALAQRGLSKKDLQPVNVTPEAVLATMATGLVDAGVTYQPSIAMILELGGGARYHVLLSSREARGMITDVLAVRNTTIEHNPELVTGLIRATLEGLSFMQREPVQATAIIAKALGISTADVASQLSSVENPSLSHLGDVFHKSDELPSFHVSGKVIGTILQREGQIEAPPTLESTYDERFVLALQAHPEELK